MMESPQFSFQAITIDEIKIGDLIVSKPYGTNLNFNKTVILVVLITENQVYGLVLNKWDGRVLKDCEPDFPESEIPVYWAGPAMADHIVALHKFGDLELKKVPVGPGTYFSKDFRVMTSQVDYKEFKTSEIRLFTGISVWTHDQFLSEYESDSWELFKVTNFNFFDCPPGLWDLFYPGFEKELSEKILPRLKANLAHPMYVDAHENDPKINLPEGIGPITEQITDDLILHYVVDQGAAFSYVNHDFYEKHPHISPGILKRMSQWNLTTDIASNMELQGDFADVVMVLAGGEFESSLILADGVMAYMQQQFGGAILVAIPTRDMLLLCKNGNDEARHKIEKMVEVYFNNPETQGLLSKGIYTISGTEIALIGSAF